MDVSCARNILLFPNQEPPINQKEDKIADWCLCKCKWWSSLNWWFTVSSQHCKYMRLPYINILSFQSMRFSQLSGHFCNFFFLFLWNFFRLCLSVRWFFISLWDGWRKTDGVEVAANLYFYLNPALARVCISNIQCIFTQKVLPSTRYTVLMYWL